MPVTIKSAREIELMRAAGKILGKVHQDLGKALKPGMTTLEIDRIGEEMIRSYGCIPSFKNYQGYPASVCVSVNDEVVHGIPSQKRVIREGDIVSLDIGVIYKGYHSDAARTHGIGEISSNARRLILHTRECFLPECTMLLQAGICIRYLPQFTIVQEVMDTVWYAIWLDMESGHICTKSRRYLIFESVPEASGFAPE